MIFYFIYFIGVVLTGYLLYKMNVDFDIFYIGLCLTSWVFVGGCVLYVIADRIGGSDG